MNIDIFFKIAYTETESLVKYFPRLAFLTLFRLGFFGRPWTGEGEVKRHPSVS